MVRNLPLSSFSAALDKGTPFSPYLFILRLEYLGLLIQGQLSLGFWKPVKASQLGPAFSHLFFADDLILFTHATLSNADVINEVFTKFCHIQGQKVIEEKSLILFFKNTPESYHFIVYSNLDMLETKKFDKYLGFPLKFSDRGQRDFDFILHKVQDKLASWQANLLSLASRRVLIQLTSSLISDYVVQRGFIPSRICKEIDCTNWNFLWGSIAKKRKLHLVSWDKVTLPRNIGVLGLYSTNFLPS